MDTLDRGNTAAGIVLSATHGGLSRAVALSRATPNISNNINRVWEEVTTYKHRLDGSFFTSTALDLNVLLCRLFVLER